MILRFKIGICTTGLLAGCTSLVQNEDSDFSPPPSINFEDVGKTARCIELGFRDYSKSKNACVN
jgi:hypothetical protein